jgi:hypothetical protein
MMGSAFLARRATLVGSLFGVHISSKTNRRILVVGMWGIKPFSCWIYLLSKRAYQITFFLFEMGGGKQ